jgi:hypothetical protein
MKKPKLNQKLQEAVLGGRGLIQRLCEDDHEVFIALAHYSDETGRCHIKGHESLTRFTYGLSESSVAASLESLRRAGFIGKEQEWVYTIHYRLDQAETFTSGQNALDYLCTHRYATVRIQAIDGTRTFTLLDSQPCRLLILPSCPFKLRSLDSYPGGTLTHCSCQPSLDAHISGLIGSSMSDSAIYHQLT